jgi:GT2 family glycosyltransferase
MPMNKSMKQNPKVAVVIIHWNRQNLLEQFLPSVLSSTYPNMKVYVADNHSTDNSVAWLKEHYPQIGIVQLDNNYGYAGGYNRALRFIESDYYILLNNDIEVSSGWIEPIINYMEQHPNVAAAQPKMIDFIHRNKFEYAGAAGGFIDYLGYPFCRGRIMDSIETDVAQYDQIKEIFWATGACMFIRSNVFHQVNGFDENFFAHMEEIDLCWRLQLMNYKLVVVPQSVVYHVGGGTLDKMNTQKTFLNFRNNLVMLTKNLPIATLLWLIPVRSTLDLLSSIVFLLQGKPSFSAAIHKAHAAYFFRWGFWWKQRNPGIKNKTYGELTGVYSHSIVWQYFVKRKRQFTDLKPSVH